MHKRLLSKAKRRGTVYSTPKSTRWMPNFRTKSVQRFRLLDKNFNRRKRFVLTTVWPTNKGPTEAMATATAAAATAATAMASINNLDLDPDLHTNQTQHLTRLATTAKRKITSRVIATRENVTMHKW
jgi:hypothetical protein